MVSGGNTISIAGTDGVIVASANFTRASFRPNPYMPWTSASKTRVYYLDKETDVHYLGLDGSTGLVYKITTNTVQQAGFAVSPDDKRIAVSLFSFPSREGNLEGKYQEMRIFVEDVMGGGNRVETFFSKTVAEYPIAWRAGLLVIAVGSPTCCDRVPMNPYAATEYHMARPETGDRTATLCAGSTFGPEGPIGFAGVLCRDPVPHLVRWDGTQGPPTTAVTSPDPYLNALSPDGVAVAAGGKPIRIEAGTNWRDLPESGYVLGWLDQQHIVFRKLGAADLSIFDFQTNSSVSLPGQTMYLGTIPASLS